MKNIPFYSNTPDDMHCVPAVFKMLYKYFFNEETTWDQIDRIMKSIPNKGTWTLVGLTDLAKRGLNVVHVEPIDYQKLYDLGIDTLRETVGEETFNYYKNNSNLESIIEYIPEYLKTVNQITRETSLSEILDYLTNEYLIGMEVNSSVLNSKEGFNLHYVLLYDLDEKYIMLHDPGLPPLQSRRISIVEFEKCFDYKGANKSMSAFRKL